MEIKLNTKVQERFNALFQQRSMIESEINDTILLIAELNDVELDNSDVVLSHDLTTITIKEKEVKP